MLNPEDIRALQTQRRYGPPSSDVLEDPVKMRKTGRWMPDVRQEDVTEESMPHPELREDLSHSLRLDPC
jgi:hypothetical protein